MDLLGNHSTSAQEDKLRRFVQERANQFGDKNKEAQVDEKYRRIMTPTFFEHFGDQTLWVCVSAFIALFIASVYVFGIGYGLGTFFFYVFVTTCGMPFEFHTMYQCAMIPGVNVVVFVIAVWILFLKFSFMAVWWFLVKFFSWVPEYIMTLIRSIGK